LLGEGGDIFVLDMGKQIKIKDLAEKMIRLSGKVPYKDIDIIYTGLRPGEKLSETLFHQHEAKENTPVAKIFKAKYREHAWAEVCNVFDAISAGFNKGCITSVLSVAATLVPEYTNHINPVLLNVANEEA
jgi:FlaA1/EpsC-like NDP-sugar epimerase